MVKIFVLSEYSTSPPAELGLGRVKIVGGPLYELVRIKQLVEDQDSIQLFSRTCIRDVQTLFDSDTEQVAALIQMLDTGNYIDSEWCENGKAGVAACDAYRVRRIETLPITGKPVAVEYFVKLAVGRNGHLVLLVSCHLS